MVRGISILFVLFSIYICCLYSTKANANNDNDIYSLSLEELLNIPVSIATKNETSLAQSPSSVSLFTRDDIERLGLRTLGDLLTRVPGFYSMMDSVEGNLSHMVMRGHAQNYANTLLVLLNGQRINDDYTGGINYLIRYFSIRDASKIEVIRGPGSALYGSNAYSGVVNIITDSTPQISATLGSLGTSALYWSDKVSVADWELGASINFYRDQGENYHNVFDRSGLQTSTNDPKTVQQLNLTTKNDQSRIDFQYLHSKRQNYYLFRRLRDGVAEVELTHWTVYGSHQLLQNERWEVDISAGYQNATRESLSALAAGSPAPNPSPDFLFGIDLEYQSANIALDASYQFSDNVKFNLGSFLSTSEIPRSYLKSNFDIYGNEDYLGEVVTFDANDSQRTVLDMTRRIQSVYAQSEWQVTPQIAVTTGLRLDNYNDIDNALTPRLSLVHALDDNQGYKLIYAEAYRAPSLGDLYDEESGLTVGNQSLKANELTSMEAVYYWHGAQTAFTASLFASHHQHIVGRSNTDDLSFLANIGSNKARGLELQLKWQPSRHWLLQSDITRLFTNRTELAEGAEFTPSEVIAPQTYLNYEVHYTPSDWSFSLSGNWRSSVESLSKQDELLLINAHIIYRWSSNLRWQLSVKNLTDEQYFTSTYSPLGTDINNQPVQELPARGRQLNLELTFQL
ncbi:TonB-dependent receptor plug domain-containing protein [Aliiglaciecola litoralis]|uniref:TonB-dependent receptor n=1 Tax=Aliiglaciecola litoralis TaxID=582857 RepID=A0ABN1LL91_9ALTE